jgi:hypothetical protein
MAKLKNYEGDNYTIVNKNEIEENAKLTYRK